MVSRLPTSCPSNIAYVSESSYPTCEDMNMNMATFPSIYNEHLDVKYQRDEKGSIPCSDIPLLPMSLVQLHPRRLLVEVDIRRAQQLAESPTLVASLQHLTILIRVDLDSQINLACLSTLTRLQSFRIEHSYHSPREWHTNYSPVSHMPRLSHLTDLYVACICRSDQLQTIAHCYPKLGSLHGIDFRKEHFLDSLDWKDFSTLESLSCETIGSRHYVSLPSGLTQLVLHSFLSNDLSKIYKAIQSCHRLLTLTLYVQCNSCDPTLFLNGIPTLRHLSLTTSFDLKMTHDQVTESPLYTLALQSSNRLHQSAFIFRRLVFPHLHTLVIEADQCTIQSFVMPRLVNRNIQITSPLSR